MIRVLHFGLSPNFGGIEKYIYDLTRSMPADINFNFINCWNKKVAYELELKKMGYHFLYITPRFNNYRRCIKDLKKIFQTQKFDYIHFHVMSYSFFEPVVLAAKYSDAKILVHYHGGGGNYAKEFSIKAKILNIIGKKLITRIKTINLACSDRSGEAFFHHRKYQVVEDGIEYDKYKFSEENRKEIRKKYHFSKNNIVLGCVGALIPIKNHSFIIEVFYRYQLKNPNARLLIVGDGYLKNELEQLAKKYSIEQKIIFSGQVKDVSKYYSAMDIYLMPSKNEGFGISLCEAQVNGLPCIVSTNFPKEVKITKNVKFLELSNANLWIKAIDTTKKNKDRHSFELSEKYSLKSTINKIIKIYKEK